MGRVCSKKTASAPSSPSFTSVIFVVTEKVATTRCQNHALLYPGPFAISCLFCWTRPANGHFPCYFFAPFFFLFIIYVYFFFFFFFRQLDLCLPPLLFLLLTYKQFSFLFFFLFSFYYLIPFFFFFLRLCSAGARLKWGTGSIPAGRMPAWILGYNTHSATPVSRLFFFFFYSAVVSLSFSFFLFLSTLILFLLFKSLFSFQPFPHYQSAGRSWGGTRPSSKEEPSTQQLQIQTSPMEKTGTGGSQCDISQCQLSERLWLAGWSCWNCWLYTFTLCLHFPSFSFRSRAVIRTRYRTSFLFRLQQLTAGSK